MSSAQNSSSGSSFANGASYSSGSSYPGDGAPEIHTASNILSVVDPAQLHPLAHISDQLDYLNLDDDKLNELPGAQTAVPSRGWGDDLCYGTGTTYLSGESSFFNVHTAWDILSQLFFISQVSLSVVYGDSGKERRDH